MNPAELLRRIKHFVMRDRMTRELEEEMRLHVELRAEQLGGAAARRRFGNRTRIQQSSRDAWGFRAVEDLVGDLKFASRRLIQQKGFTLAVVSVMAIGIGATTAMFSTVDAVLLRPLPFRNPDQLVVVPEITIPWHNRPPTGNPQWVVSIDEVTAMRETFSNVAVYGAGGLNLSGDGQALRVNAGVVSADFFNLLGASTLAGRTFSAEEGLPDGPNVVVLSYGLWQRRFGGRSIEDLQIVLNDRTFQVIGVMANGFTFPEASDLWVPMSLPITNANFDAFQYRPTQTVIARVADGLSVKQAELRLFARWLSARNIRNKGKALETDGLIKMFVETGAIVPMKSALSVDRTKALYVLLGATAVLLLIACVNVTNLLLAQGANRAREIAVRQTLGATRFRIVRQLLTESVLLSVCGAVLGVVLAPVLLNVADVLVPKALADVATLRLDVRVLSFASAMALLTGVLFGIWPALGSTRRDSSEKIRSSSGHGATGHSSGRLRRVLVGAELALTVVLLAGAGIMLRTFQQVLDRDTGTRAISVGTVEIAMPRTIRGGADLMGRIDAFVAAMARTPGIVAAGAIDNLPLAGNYVGATELDGVAEPKLGTVPKGITVWRTSGEYFRALGIPLVAGRYFDSADELRGRTVLINATMANAYWPGQSAIGRTFLFPHDTVPSVVVGVVAEVPHSLDEERRMQLYRPMREQPTLNAVLVARGAASNEALLRSMQIAIRSVDPSQAFFHVRTMDEVRSASIAPRRTTTLLIAAFALLALLLASVGVYGVVSFGVSNRSRELGIRSALGATGAALVRFVSREMLWVSTVGVTAGFVAAWALARILESQMYGVSVHDGLVFVLVPLILVIPTALATLVPARRALKLNPSDVMRAD